ncbi:MAG: hypothetical protein GY754_29425 [bacterium]|nr:hypothetical protein [bacterium]
MKTNLILLLVLIIIYIPRCRTQEIPENEGSRCFQVHLEEAIVKNTIRKTEYARWAETKSIPASQALQVSESLIAMEELSLPIAKIIDKQAIPWQEAGLSIVCHEFVSMDLAPDYSESWTAPAYSRTSQTNNTYAADLRTAYYQGGFSGLSTKLEEIMTAVDAADADKRYNCMLRHTLESMLRISNKAEEHAQMAAAAQMESTASFSWAILQLHLDTLDQVIELDDLAAPFHTQGIPIICQDVPVIPAD